MVQRFRPVVSKPLSFGSVVRILAFFLSFFYLSSVSLFVFIILIFPFLVILPGRTAQSVVRLTHEPEVAGSIPGPATYFRFCFR